MIVLTKIYTYHLLCHFGLKNFQGLLQWLYPFLFPLRITVHNLPLFWGCPSLIPSRHASWIAHLLFNKISSIFSWSFNAWINCATATSRMLYFHLPVLAVPIRYWQYQLGCITLVNPATSLVVFILGSKSHPLPAGRLSIRREADCESAISCGLRGPFFAFAFEFGDFCPCQKPFL